MADPDDLRVAGRNRDCADVRSGRLLDLAPARSGRGRIGRFGVIGAPQRLSAGEDAIGLVWVENERRDEQRVLGLRLRNLEGGGLPLPGAGCLVPEQTAD